MPCRSNELSSVWKKCVVCGESFHPKINMIERGITCSPACLTKRQREHTREWIKTHRPQRAKTKKPFAGMVYLGDGITVYAPNEPVVSGRYAPLSIQPAAVGGECERAITEILGRIYDPC